MTLLSMSRENIEDYLESMTDLEEPDDYEQAALEIAKDMLNNQEIERAFDSLLNMDLTDVEIIFSEILFWAAGYCHEVKVEKLWGNKRTNKLIDQHAGGIAAHLKAALIYTPHFFAGESRMDMEKAIEFYEARSKGRRPGAPIDHYVEWMIILVRSLFVEKYGRRRGMNKFIAHIVNAFCGTEYTHKTIAEKVTSYRKRTENSFFGD